MKYVTCAFCGSNLDHGEKCDCQKNKPDVKTIEDRRRNGEQQKTLSPKRAAKML